ncbi:MAG: segregation and condensation protein A [Planctomycetota bacterium]|nr:MAG: segregation and condensation protein A [Planctomycetota bacterium]
MTDQVFELDNFRGPLDLLLHLVREQELEIEDVDVSHLCDQYLAALEALKAVDINVAGEFLVMASTLLLVKSRALLPCEEEVDLEEELDPGDELIQQLLEYRQFKTLSMELGQRAEDRGLRQQRGTRELPPDEENELEEIEIWDLVGSFVRLMEEIGLKREFHTLSAERPLREYIRDTLRLLSSRPRWTLREIVEACGPRDQVYGFFLSLLELTKTQQIRVRQDGHVQAILIELREDRDPGRLAFSDADSLREEQDAPAERALEEVEAISARPPTADGLDASDAMSKVVPAPRHGEADG